MYRTTLTFFRHRIAVPKHPAPGWSRPFLAVQALTLALSVAFAAPAFAAKLNPTQQALVPYIGSSATSAILVTATDNVFEDKVVVTWPKAINQNVFWRVKRDGVLLTVLSSQDSSYTDTSGLAGQTYQYCVTLTDAVTKTAIDLGCDNGSRIIHAPTQVAASDGQFDSKVFITWSDQSTIEANYRVFRNGTLLVTLPVNTEAYSDTTAVPGTTYNYCVRAVDEVGQTSAQACDDGSRGFSNPPTDVKASDGQYASYVLITWGAPANTSGFHVYRNGTQIAALDDTARTYQDATAANHVTYTYCVTSLNAQSQESVKACDTGGRGILAAPLNVGASDATYDDKVRVSWSDPGDTEDGFKVFRQAPLQPSTLIATLAANSTSFEDVDAVPGVDYRYCVVAFSNGGGVSDSTCDMGQRSPIVAPSAVNATDGTLEDRVDISWESSATNVVLFNIYRDGTVVQTVSGTVRSTSDYNVATDVHHQYCVRAVTALEVESGASCDSGYRALKAPSELTASDNTQESYVLLSWKDNSAFETGYVIERKLPAAPSFSIIDSVAAGHTSYLDSKGTSGIVYLYQVRAFDALGTATSGPTDLGSRTLATPGSVAATDGAFETKIVVTWLDQSAAETGYNIYRKIGGGAYLQIGFVPANTTSFEDVVGVGETYTYEIAAHDDYGESAGGEDVGSTAILAPGAMSASDIYTDKVTLTWVDRSGIETGYVVTRDGATLTTTASNVTTYTDNTAVAGTTYQYCVRAKSGARESADVCDAGVMSAPAALSTQIVSPVPLPSVFIPFKGIAVHKDDAVFTSGSAFADTVHVLHRDTGSWSEVLSLPGDVSMGQGLDLDDQHLIVGKNSAVTIYTRDASGNWATPATINGASSSFGDAVAIHGTRAVVVEDNAGPGSLGRAFVYHLVSGTWQQEQVLNSPGDTQFGHDADIDDDRAIISSLNNTYIYKRTGTTWALETTINLFGYSVNIDGTTAVIGGSGSAWAYEFANGSWSQTGVLNAGGGSAIRSAAVEGDLILVGRTQGQAYLYRREGSGWGLARSITSSDAWTSSGDVDLEGGTAMMVADHAFPAIPPNNFQKIFLFDVISAPTGLTASDGEFAARVQLNWKDNSSNEDGFHVYRDGALIDSTDANVHSYSDYDAEPGRVYEYSVAAFAGASESSTSSDLGRRPADGSITGHVSTRAGAGVGGVQVSLDPSPATSLLFDGAQGKAEVTGFEDGSPAFDKITVEFWMKSRATAPGTLFSYLKDGSNRLFIVLENDGTISVQLNALGTFPTHSSQVVNDGQWHHVAVLWDGTLSLQTPYTVLLDVDGAGFQGIGYLAEVAKTIATGGLVTLGQFPGELDEVRVWRAVRNAPDLAANRFMTVDPATAGLVLALPLDEGVGPASHDDAGHGEYARLSGGAFWSKDVAPVLTTAMTDAQGDYSMKRIQYGKGATFRVIPQLGPHQFEPAYKSISLSGASPVQNEVAFNDISSFTLSGKVVLDSTTCAAAGVQVLLDDVPFNVTGEDGRYAIAAGFGSHTLKLKQGNRVFYPAQYTLNVSGDTGGLDFTDKTARMLTGKVGGGCNQPIGTVTFEVRAEDGCSIVTRSAASNIAVKLGPRKYLVQVTDVSNVPAQLDRSEILKFFQALGPQTVDLTNGDSTVDLIYRAPIVVEITGFDLPSCPNLILPDNVSIPAVPILNQGDKVPLTIHVYEDYGNGNHCPLDSGKVAIFDEIVDEQDQPVELEVKNGEAHYTTIANTPNVFPGRIDSQGHNRSFQKSLTAVADIPGQGTITALSWVLVTGSHPRAGTFTSTTDGIPALILRDPPGDGSASFVERGQKFCTSFKNMGFEKLASGLNVKAKVGIKFQKGTPFLSSTTAAQVESEEKFRLGLEATEESGMDMCAETLERWSTPTDDGWLNGDGDIIMGAAINLLFTKTDVLDLQGCTVKKSEAIALGSDGFSSTYFYTVQHIRDVIIPQLVELAETQPGQRNHFLSEADNWRRQLKLNDSLKTASIAKATASNQKKNLSFSAGADYDFSNTTDSTKTFDWSVRVFTSAELAEGLGFEETGNETSAQWATDLEFAYEHAGTTDSTHSTTVGYQLADDDLGDFFSVDVATDSTYGTPVFKTISGRSSCPVEKTTQPRDSVIIRIEPPIQDAVDPDGAAHFVLSLTNASQSDEEREVFIQPVQTTNPDGASIFLVGDTFLQLAVNLEPGQTHTWELNIRRGASKYRYDNIAIMAIPVCQFEFFRKTGITSLADTAYFSVHFQAPCSDITLFEPQPGWSYNKATSVATSNKIHMTLTDYKLAVSETDSIQAIGAQYRLAGTDAWQTIVEIPRNLITGKSQELDWNVAAVPDGQYELRAYTRCSAGNTYSTAATGRIDRKSPQAFGAPQPADSLLSLGDEISITFDEDIDCSTVNAQNVTLQVNNPDNSVDPVEISTSCNGRTVIITPTNPEYPLLEGKKLRARVTGIQDLLGNPMVGPNNSAEIAWRTDVRRNVFTWKEISVARQVPYRNPGSLTATLVNGTSAPVSFNLTGFPVWLSAVPNSGTIPAGGSLPVQLVLSSNPALLTLGPGNAPKTYTATLNANVTTPPITSPLAVAVTIFCSKPDWTVSAGDFQYSMTVVAQEQINGATQTDANDKVGAFVGSQLRGVASPQFVPALNSWLTFITVYSNRTTGENVRFQVFDDSDCRLYTGTGKTVRFDADKREGTTAAPDLLNVQDLVPGSLQQIAVNEGWTWISFNLTSATDMTVNGVLGDLNPSPGDLVKSLTQFSQFDPAAGWAGTLGDFNNLESYALDVSEAGTIIHEGTPVQVATTSIPVANGWNWIPYLPQVPQATNIALQLLAPQNGDVIKSQTQFAQYVKSGNVATWLGDLATLKPGLGYRLNLGNASVIQNQFKYFAPAQVLLAGGGSVPLSTDGSESNPVLVNPTLRTLGPDWHVDARNYPFNMTVTGELQSAGVPVKDDRFVVAAMVGGEIRGLAQPQYVAGVDKYLVFLMVYGKDGETAPVTFRLYDMLKQEIVDLDGSVAFGPDVVKGSIMQPFALQTGSVIASTALPVEFSLSQNVPNPPKGLVTIRFAMPQAQHVVLKMHDVAGREVLKLLDGDLPAGFHSVTLDSKQLPSGLYFYRMHAGEFVQTRKMIVVN